MMNNQGNITVARLPDCPQRPKQVRRFRRRCADLPAGKPDVSVRPPGASGECFACHVEREQCRGLFRSSTIHFRRRYESLKTNHLSLIRAGRENQSHLDELRSVFLQLIRVSSIPAVVATILDTFGHRFEVPFVVLGVEANRNETGEFHVEQFRRLTPGSVERLMGDQDCLLSPVAGQEAIIFVDHADEVQSCALYRLSIGMQRRPGVLAFGTRGSDILSRTSRRSYFNLVRRRWRCSQPGI